jgi:hypothetical protein
MGCGGGAASEDASGSGGNDLVVDGGGAKPTGGSTGSGGAKATGGATGSGGATGGSTGSGGATKPATGGSTGSGGASATGGATGSGGALPHQVTDCSALGTAGVWQEVSPSAFHNPSNMETTCVAVDPRDQSVYASATNKTNGGNGSTGLLRSTDCGATWNKVSTTAKLETGACFALLTDPVRSGTMYYANGYGDDPTLWKSTDFGVTFAPLAVDPANVTNHFVDKAAMDPLDSLHIVLSFHGDCSGSYGPQCLSETTDGGASWRLVKGPDKGWAEGNRIGMFGGASWFYLSVNGGWFTQDSGATWHKVICWDPGTAGCLAVGGAPTEIFVSATRDHAYVPVPNSGVFESSAGGSTPFGQSWTKIAGSPSSFIVASDGVSLYAAQDYTSQPFLTATLGAPTAWTHMSTPNIGRRSNQFAYEDDHHLLYSANLGGGLWRLVTR